MFKNVKTNNTRFPMRRRVVFIKFKSCYTKTPCTVCTTSEAGAAGQACCIQFNTNRSYVHVRWRGHERPEFLHGELRHAREPCVDAQAREV